MARRAFSFRITLSQVGPLDPEFRAAPATVKAEVLRWLVIYGLKEKDADLAKGLDKEGEPLAAITEKTREDRESEQGPADPNAPPLMPAYAVSRTRLLLEGAPTDRGDAVEFFWAYDPFTGGSWGQILDYQRRGIGKRKVKRDVIGISDEALSRIRDQIGTRWAAWKRAGLAVGWKPPPKPIPKPAPLTVRGRTDFESFTYATSGAAESRRALAVGGSTGFFQRRPGAGWTAYGGPEGGGRPRPWEPEPPLAPGKPRRPRPVAPKPVPPPPPPPPPPRVLGESTRAEYEALRDQVAKLPEFGFERRRHVLEWIRERTGIDTTAERQHGMTDFEDLHHLKVDEITYRFPKLPPKLSAEERKRIVELEAISKASPEQKKWEEYDKKIRAITEKYPLIKDRPASAQKKIDELHNLQWSIGEERRKMANELYQLKTSVHHPFVNTLTNMAEKPEWPVALQGVTKEVIFSKQTSKDDPYWKVTYNDPNHVSAATGGDGNVVVYNGGASSFGTMTHETGHNFATVKSKERGDGAGTNPGPDFRKAMATSEKPVSAYATKSPAEDFAEAVKEFVADPTHMKAIAPERYKVIKRLMEEPTYGG